MQHRTRNVMLAASLAVGCAAQTHAADPNDFAVFNYDLYNNGVVDMFGRLYVPSNYDAAKSYPLVIFFHGAGEVGSDNTSQVNGNIDNLLAAAKSRQFFLYAPQTNGTWGVNQFDTVLDMVAKAAKTYSIDTSRLYTTGLSLGGGATWDINSIHPGTFAAAVPLSGTTPSQANYATALSGIPIWAYHAQDDANGPTKVLVTRTTINNIRAAQGLATVSFPLNASPANPFYNTGSPYYTDGSTFFNDGTIRYSEYATGGHSNATWGRAYAEQPMYDWLLAQSHPQAKPAAGQTLLFDFGATQNRNADSQGRLWNSTQYSKGKTLEAAIAFARTTTGVSTGVTIDVTDKFDSDDTGGATSGALYDSDFASDGWGVVASNHTAALSSVGKLVIRGLQPGGAYRLALFASQISDDPGYGKVTRYTIGSDWRDLNVVGNLTNQAIFESVPADAAGNIELTVGVSPIGNSRYAYLGAMELTTATVPEPASGVLVMLASAGLLARRRR